jgi:pyridoxamine 5'-phosphate oxidase
MFERQIWIEGTVSKVSREESNASFQSRPLLSRLGAIVSMQSEVIPSREFFEHRLQQVEQTYPDGQTPIPPSWGGYRIEPRLFEFWQGRPNRLHDRLRYALREGGSWIIERLSP